MQMRTRARWGKRFDGRRVGCAVLRPWDVCGLWFVLYLLWSLSTHWLPDLWIGIVCIYYVLRYGPISHPIPSNSEFRVSSVSVSMSTPDNPITQSYISGMYLYYMIYNYSSLCWDIHKLPLIYWYTDIKRIIRTERTPPPLFQLYFQQPWQCEAERRVPVSAHQVSLRCKAINGPIRDSEDSRKGRFVAPDP